MANRLFVRNTMSLEKNPCVLYAKITVGATGAPTIDALKSKGVLSIVRTGIGAYNINFGGAAGLDTYQRLLGATYISIAATSTAMRMQIVAAQASVAANPRIQIQFVDSANASVEIGNGEIIHFTIVLSNSTAN